MKKPFCRLFDDVQTVTMIYNGDGKPITLLWGDDEKEYTFHDDGIPKEIPESMEEAEQIALSCCGCTGWKVEWL